MNIVSRGKSIVRFYCLGTCKLEQKLDTAAEVKVSACWLSILWIHREWI